MTDEELQNNAERDLTGNSLDERSYRKVFDALRKEPAFQLPPQFSSHVLSRITMNIQQSPSRDMVWLYLGIFSFTIAMAVAVALTGFKVNMGVLKFIASYPGLFVFGTIFILALHWIDRRAINKQTI